MSFEKGNPLIFVYAGNSYVELKNYNKAEEILREGLSLFDSDDDLNFQIAIVYDKTGRFEDMERHLKKAFELNPKNADALNYLGYTYADKGINLEEALSLIKRALELKPDNGYITDSLGWVYFRLGRFQDALSTILRAVDIVKDDAVIYEHLGDVYKELGDYKQALSAWSDALRFHEKEEGLKERVENKIRDLKSKTENR